MSAVLSLSEQSSAFAKTSVRPGLNVQHPAGLRQGQAIAGMGSSEMCASKHLEIQHATRGMLDEFSVGFEQKSDFDAFAVHKHAGSCVVNPYSAWACAELTKP